MSHPDSSSEPLFSVDPTANPTGTLIEIHEAHTSLITQLNEAVGSITTTLESLGANQTAADTRFSSIDSRLADLASNLTTISTQLTGIALQPSAPAASGPRTIKGAKLEQFSGKVHDLERFLQDLRDDIELQGSTFTSNRQKSLYMTTFLCNTQTAHDWVTGIRKTEPTLLDDFSAFTKAFEAHFGASNKVEEALRKLCQLKQSGSASSYAACFREISAALPQEEFFLSNMFFEGLKQEVQKWIYGLPEGKVSDLDKLISRAIEGDNRLHEWSRTNKSNTSTTSRPSTTSTPSPLPVQVTSGPAPMELGATRIMKPLDAAEKERRKANGPCGYCGGTHQLNACQLLKEKNDRKAKASGKASPRA